MLISVFPVVWSDPGVAGGQRAVEVPGADGMDLPAHRVVQGVNPGVAPVPIEVELGQGGAAARQLEQLLAGLQGDVGGQHLGFGDHDGRPCRGLRIDRRGSDFVQHPASLVQQRFGGMQLQLQLADVGDDIRVIAGALDVVFDPWARTLAHEANAVVDRFTGDTGVDGRLNQLRYRALNIGRQSQLPVFNDQLAADPHVFQQHAAAGGGALTETGPVINDVQALAAARHDYQYLIAVVVDCLDRNPMREQRARRVELAAVEQEPVTVGRQAGFHIQGVFG